MSFANRFNTFSERNRAIRKAVKQQFGKSILSVRGGMGTACAWIEITTARGTNGDQIENFIVSNFKDDLDTYDSDDGYGTERYCILIQQEYA